MNRLPVFVCACVSLALGMPSIGQEPKRIKAAEIPNMVKHLPQYVGFGYCGAAYLQKCLYVSCNLGLLSVPESGDVELLQWRSNDSVIEGPWLDFPNHRLWARQSHDGSFVRFDGKKWDAVPMPEAPDGYFTRGDALSGFRCTSTKESFYLEGANAVWCLNQQTDKWQLEPLPKLPEGSGIRAFLPFRDKKLYYVRVGYQVGIDDSPVDNKAAIYSSPGEWHEHAAPYFPVEEYVITEEGAFVRSEDGKVYDLSGGTAVRIECPAPCEAIARSSGGALFASFKEKGVFLRTGKTWTLKVKSPYDPGEGEHWAHLAEDGGHIVLVTEPVPQLKSVKTLFGSDYKTEFNSKAELWISKGGDFQRLPLVP